MPGIITILAVEDDDDHADLLDFAIRRAQAARVTERKSLFDSIARPGSRACFIRQLESAIARADRHGGGFALAFIDPDRFKAANNSYGHAAGDEVLATIRDRVRMHSRVNDCLCRLGGDEFVVLLDGVVEPGQAVGAAERYTAPIETLIPLRATSNIRVYVGASLGLALWRLDGIDARTLLSSADTRRYANKAGRARNRRAG